MRTSTSTPFSMLSLIASLALLTAFFSAIPAVSADSQIPLPGLPLKTHIFADSSCAESRASLYYLPAGFCIGPLYHPGSSVRVLESVPRGCNLTAYSDGHCKGLEMDMSESFKANDLTKRGRKRKTLAGPTGQAQCYGVGSMLANREEGQPRQGANSLFLRC